MRSDPDAAEAVRSILTQSGSSTRIATRATPKSRRPGIQGVHDGRLKIGIAAPAQDGRANDALTDLIAEICGCPKKAVSVRTGHASREKSVEVADMTVEQVAQKILALLAPQRCE